MDIEKLCDLTIRRFVDGGGRSEVPVGELRSTINRYLKNFYNKTLRKANIILSMRKEKGEDISEKHYEMAIRETEDATIAQSYAISAANYNDMAELEEIDL